MKKHAVLVGINAYKRLGPLRYARQDAEAVANALKRCYGFSDDEITLMTDESKNSPEDRYAIQEALSPDFYASDLELFIFGFWGHGIWENENRYLCPMNVRDNVPKSLRASGIHQTPYYTCAGGSDILLPAVKPSKSMEELVEEEYRTLKQEKEQERLREEACRLARKRLEAEERVQDENARQEVEERGNEQERLKAEKLTKVLRMVKTIGGVEYAFRWCPAGSFMMGKEGWFLNNAKLHSVTLTMGFWMLETQVTQAMWESVMGSNPSSSKGDKLPVENVSWDDCQDFCKKLCTKGLQVSLPTEAQWEYACRAGSTGDYAGNLDEMAWYFITSVFRTHEVGLKMPNAWGLYDMHGNVWEWCQDWYKPYDELPTSDPTGPDKGTHGISRGGGWISGARNCQSTYRCYLFGHDYRNNDLGFRLVCRVESSR